MRANSRKYLKTREGNSKKGNWMRQSICEHVQNVNRKAQTVKSWIESFEMNEQLEPTEFFVLTPLRYRLRSKGHPQAPPWQKSWYFHQLIDCIYVFSFDLLLSWEHTCGVALVDVSFLFMMKILHSMFVVLCLTQISNGSLSQWIFNFSPDWRGVLTVLHVYEEPSSLLTEIVCELAATPKWTATSGGNK